MANPEQVKQFFEQLSEFWQAEPRVILEYLKSLHTESNPDFANLLLEYYDNRIAFYPLLAHERVDLLTDIFIYLIGVNERILHEALYLDECPYESLLELMHIDDIDYKEILEWLDAQRPQVIERYEASRCELMELQEELFNLCKTRNYPAVLEKILLQPSLCVHKVLALNDCELLDCFIEQDGCAKELSILKCLIDLDQDVLKMKLEEQSLYLYLSENAFSHIRLLIHIYERHAFLLDDDIINRIKIALAPCFTPLDEQKTFQNAIEASLQRGGAGLKTLKPLLPCVIQRTFFKAESPWHMDQHLYNFINIKHKLESIVIDAFIHQVLFEPLLEQGILVLPTIKHHESFSLEQFLGLKHGTHLTFDCTIGLEIMRGRLEAVVGQKSCETPPQFVIRPVNNVDISHYGLLIIDLRVPEIDVLKHVYYVEPLCLLNQIKSFGLQSSEDLLTREDTILPQFYQRYIHRLNEQLNINPRNIEYIHLLQPPQVNFCSDYVIAVLMRLARGTLNVTSNTFSSELNGSYLMPDDVKSIRLMQIQQFGLEYFQYQTEDLYKPYAQSFLQQYFSALLRCPKIGEDLNASTTFPLKMQVCSKSVSTQSQPPVYTVHNIAQYIFFRNHCGVKKHKRRDDPEEKNSTGYGAFIEKRSKNIPSSPLGRSDQAPRLPSTVRSAPLREVIKMRASSGK